MLFNSYVFMFLFLPLTLAGFFWIGRASAMAATAWLTAASLIFYSWWNWHFSFLLLASALFNHGAGQLIARAPPGSRTRRGLLIAAIGADLAVLGWFKYVNFLLNLAGSFLGLQAHGLDVVLPIGISFFTFTQIAYLVDTAGDRANERNLISYLLFVTYFPHLLAGPVLHHAEMMPQFARPETCRPRAEAIAVGLTVFILGLFKKVVLADSVAPFADRIFDTVGHGTALGAGEAWAGALAYTLQIYFDFSGYSDMAIGISRMFNIVLPINFESPYQARSIVEFWRRWHISLSRFLRDYLYIPLGGNRKGPVRRHVNLMATMLLGGLWHGAGLTFVIWGGLHGLYLVVNHVFRHAVSVSPLAGMRWPFFATVLWTLFCWALTFLSVLVAWVFFRAHDLDAAWLHLGSMAGLHLHAPAAAKIPSGWLIELLAIALFLPNVRHILAGHDIVSLNGTGFHPDRIATRWPSWLIQWRPHPALALLVLAVFAVSMNFIARPSPFLYYQF